MPADRQLNLFAGGGVADPGAGVGPTLAPATPPGDLDDHALIVAIPVAGQTRYRALIDELIRRRPAGAVDALESLCRRFKGFGLQTAIPEQIAAVEAIAGIGGIAAMQALTRVLVQQVVQGPGLAAAVAAARRLGCRLPAATALALLRHQDPAVRAHAAGCAPSAAEVVATLTDLLGDLHPAVAGAAACALGRMGHKEARPPLLRLLVTQPSADVIEAVVNVADEDCIVQLGRIARGSSAFSAAAIAALEDLDGDRAKAILAAIRRAAKA